MINIQFKIERKFLKLAIKIKFLSYIKYISFNKSKFDWIYLIVYTLIIQSIIFIKLTILDYNIEKVLNILIPDITLNLRKKIYNL